MDLSNQNASSTYCAAKWFEGTIWLYQGTTANCHHNPFHKIVLETNNPSSIYNTPQKIAERSSMLVGGKPNGCNYCWTAEEAGRTSDRIIKTDFFNKKNITSTSLTPLPQILEIAFERTCNLACAYCGPHFSSKWANDIKKSGPYINLVSDSRYTTDSGDDIIDPDNNPFIDAFFAWWPELETHLPVLKITGGEPLMSPSFWKFLDLLNASKKFKGNLTINTNLISHKDEIERLIDKTQDINLRIHTSIESNFKQAEYVRDGFESETWLANVTKILNSKCAVVSLNTAINNLSVWSFDEYLKIALDLKSKFGNSRVETTCNFVHYPTFMRVGLVPQFYQHAIAEKINKVYTEFKPMFSAIEQQQIDRVIDLLSNAPIEIADVSLLNDLKQFVSQYDQRRTKNYKESLDVRFVEWYDSI
jgi:organic radical activating enzyme